MNAKTVMWCDCGECADCRPDLHKKENECVRCGCYNLSEFKKVERKHIHCLDCYKQQRNEKQRENRKQKREVFVCKGCGENIGDNGFCTEGCRFGEYAGIWDCEKCGKRCEDCEFCPDCGEYEEEPCESGDKDGFENCDCGYIHHCEDKCPNETTRQHYERWKEEDLIN